MNNFNWLLIATTVIVPLATVVGGYLGIILSRRSAQENRAAQFTDTLSNDNASLRQRVSALEVQMTAVQSAYGRQVEDTTRLRVFTADIYTKLVSLAAWVRLKMPGVTTDPDASVLLDIPPAPPWLSESVADAPVMPKP